MIWVLTKNLPSYFYGDIVKISHFKYSSLHSNGVIRSDNQSIDTIFPLYLYPRDQDLFSGERVPNIAPRFIQHIEKTLGISSDPEEVFSYVYALFYSSQYRTRYADFLKMDYPRILVTFSKTLFLGLAKIGKDLVNLHLMKPKLIESSRFSFDEAGSCMVDKVFYNRESKRVYINSNQFFSHIESDVWTYTFGAYQVCGKWLKDRKGQKLSEKDVEHYQRIVATIIATEKAVNEIDNLISNYGGWQKAFRAKDQDSGSAWQQAA